LTAVQQYWPNSDIGIFAAAVADYRPSEPSSQKIKKNQAQLSLELTRTEDTLAWAGKGKQAHQFLVGFALETSNGESYAREKLVKKNLDAVVLNVLGENGVGFNSDTNKIRIFGCDGQDCDYPLESKVEIAKRIVDYIIQNK
jgi:phosphopantothenoylcysteine decarboxylase/phosphopantothenate--cysteine ligase